MSAVGSRVLLTAGALVALVGCYGNNGGWLDLDGGVGNLGPTGPVTGGSGGADGGVGGTPGDGGVGGAGGELGGGGAGGIGGTGDGGTGGEGLAGAWQPPVVIDSHQGTGLNPDVGIGPDGRAVAVWVQSFLGEYNVIANEYTVAGGWDEDAWIGSTDGNTMDLTQTSQPAVVVDEASVATAAWGDFTDPILRGVVSRRSAPGGGWSGIELVYDGPSTAGDPTLAVDAAGNVLAGFSTGTGAWANYFEQGAGWGDAEIIDNRPNQPIGVGVGLDASGAGWALWSQAPSGLVFDAFGNRFDPGTGWGDAAPVEDRTMGSALAPDLAVGGTGDALFVWQETAGLRYQVWSSAWIAAENRLASPVRLDEGGSATVPSVAMDASGRGVAVWLEAPSNGGTPLSVAAARYAPGDGWTDRVVLSVGDIRGEPRVAVDDAGNAVVAYNQKVEYEDQVDTWAQLWTGGRWQDPVRLGLDERTGDAFQPSVAMSPGGRAVVVWREGPDIWASTFE